MSQQPPKLLLLDTASLYFRAYYGVPESVKSSDGTSVNAVRGLLDMIAKLITLYRPGVVVACWDDDWRPQWRVELIPTYKAHRVIEVAGAPDIEDVPDALVAQLPLIREMLTGINVPIVGASGYEADDIIATLAAQALGPVDIVTGDRDLFQLVDDARGVRVIYTARGMSKLDDVTAETVIAKYGVRPDQYADFATLRGDASDGLPGVAGIGDKTAATLLKNHETLDAARAAAVAGVGMSAAMAAKILAAVDYLNVAPRVVKVVQNVDVSAPARPLAALASHELDDARAHADHWSYRSALTRFERALASVAPPER